MKALTLIFALALPLSAFAVGPVQPSDKIVIKTEQFKGVTLEIERRIGRALSDQEKAGLEQEMFKAEYESQVLNIDYRDASRTLVCVGGGFNVGVQMTRAACVSFSYWPWRTYDVATIGAGIGLEIKASIFRLKISYDSSKYDANFDPIPGNYGLVSQGLALGVGVSWYLGDSGNKSVTGKGLTLLGIGGDYFTMNGLMIQ